MYKEVMKWLSIQHMPVAESYLRLRLESHPDYPSLIAVQDTLEELGINSYACSGTKEELKNENRPFLAHFNIGEGYIMSFKDVANAEQKVKDFDNTWSGNVMFAEPTKKTGNAEHDKLYKKEKLNRFFCIAAIFLFASVLLGLSIAAGSVSAILLTASNSIGLYFSWLIAQKEFGISNSVSDKICSMAKHSRCESVLFSKGAKLFNWLTWGDVGIVYFSSSLLYLLISLLTNQPISLYYIISIAGLIFPIYSLYYQLKIVKQWCMLCIGVLAVLGINAIIGFVQLSTISLHITGVLVNEVLLLTGVICFILAAWQLLKSLFQKSLTSLSNEIKATRLKRSPEIFKALLDKQELKQINLPCLDDSIRFGKSSAPYQLVIACNPYCDPCAEAHQAIEDLYEKYPFFLAVSLRFVVFSLAEDNSVTKATSSIIRAIKEDKKSAFEVTKDWYKRMNFDWFMEKYQTENKSPIKELEFYKNWVVEAEIRSTPKFFINGRQLPTVFNWKTFIEYVEYIIRDENDVCTSRGFNRLSPQDQKQVS